ncbi:MAG: hypothetical protein AAF654_06125 [Myxococcota bacterium]
MKAFRCVSLFVLTLAVGCAGGQSTAQKPEITEPKLEISPGTAKVYAGPRNIRVEIAELPVGAEAHSLIRITGTRSFVDGHVLPHTFERLNRRTEVFSTPHQGYDRTWLHVTDRDRFSLYLPGTADERVDLKLAEGEEPDVDKLVLDYEGAKADGSLAEFAGYSRERELSSIRERLDKAFAKAQAACPTELSADFVLDKVSDESLRSSRGWFGSFCINVVESVASFCEDHPRTAAKLPKLFTTVACEAGDEYVLAIYEGRLALVAESSASNSSSRVRDFLLAQKLPGDTEDLGTLARYEDAKVCTDGKGHYVGHWGSGDNNQAVLYGDDQTLMQTLNNRPFSTGQFFDPREENPETNGSFRGIDYRYISQIKVDTESNGCELRCGSRKISMTQLNDDDRESLLRSAKMTENPRKRRPFALARDRKQRYFLVDTGLEQGSKDYRVYAGRRGKMEQLKMTNVVDDTEGVVFSTKEGTLRLIIEKETSFWTEGKRTVKLVNVPIGSNEHLIYSGLGVYVGEPFGTPCDDL